MRHCGGDARAAAKEGRRRVVTAEAARCSVRVRLEAAGIEDAAFDAAQLLREVTGEDGRAHPARVLSEQEQQTLFALAERRSRREPLQYLCGAWDFRDFTLAVGPGVLIPRADTECVCEAAMEAAKAAGPGAAVLDLCSGTGAIAIGVARAVPGARVTAVELSAEAFCYLAHNVRALAPGIATVQADVFTWQDAVDPASLDVLVCNPPYIAPREMATLAPELAFEPRMALEAGEEGLAFYRHIAKAYRPALRAGAAVVFEIGSGQAEAVRAILVACGYEAIAVAPDAAGLPRCVTAKNGTY